MFVYFNDGYNQETAKELLGKIKNMLGSFVVSVESGKRTNKQNNFIHAIFPEIADFFNSIGVPLVFGKIEAMWTPMTAKEFFILAYLGGKRTSKCSKGELCDGLDKFLMDLSKNGLPIESKSGLIQRTLSIKKDIQKD